MPNITRHVGRMTGTDQRIVVTMLQIPGREDHALVVATDNMPPLYEQAIMDILKSPEAQSTETFAEVLGRRILPSTGRDVFTSLHEAGLLTPVPASKVLMLPMPNMPIPLTRLLAEMGRSTTAEAPEPLGLYSESKFNPHVNNQNAASNEQRTGIARNLLVEASMLEAEAAAKREKAYGFAPEMRPQVVETPAVATEVVLTEAAAEQTLSVPVTTGKPKTARKPAAKKTGV